MTTTTDQTVRGGAYVSANRKQVHDAHGRILSPDEVADLPERIKALLPKEVLPKPKRQMPAKVADDK